MTTYIGRLDTHGLILWLPSMPSPAASEIVKQDIAEIVARAPDAGHAMQLLDMHGYSLRLKVNYHGPQTYAEWSLSARADTRASALLAEMS